MPLKVTYDHPAFPTAHEFSLGALGVFENGKAREVTDEQERAYVAENGVSVKDGLKGNKAIKVEGTATVSTKDLDALLGVDVSDTPSLDPTALNIDPDTGKVFEHHNIAGAVTTPDSGIPQETVEQLYEESPLTSDNS